MCFKVLQFCRRLVIRRRWRQEHDVGVGTQLRGLTVPAGDF